MVSELTSFEHFIAVLACRTAILLTMTALKLSTS